MKNDILLEYRMLRAEEVNRELFRDFIRHQNVTKCWRKESGKWIIKDAPFMDDWTETGICLSAARKMRFAACG